MGASSKTMNSMMPKSHTLSYILSVISFSRFNLFSICHSYNFSNNLFIKFQYSKNSNFYFVISKSCKNVLPFRISLPHRPSSLFTMLLFIIFPMWTQHCKGKGNLRSGCDPSTCQVWSPFDHPTIFI